MDELKTQASDAHRTMERRYRTMVRLNLGLMLGLVVACVSSAARPGGDHPSEIRASAFILVDASGTELGRFACDEGGASIAMWNEAQDTAAVLGVGTQQIDETVTISGKLDLDGAQIGKVVVEESGKQRPVGILALSCTTVDGEYSTVNLFSAGTENIWSLNQGGSDEFDGGLYLINRSDGTIMSLEGEDAAGYTVATLAAAAEGGNVSISNDDFDASLGYHEGRAALNLSRDELKGPELEIRLTEDRASLTMKDAQGNTVASYPE